MALQKGNIGFKTVTKDTPLFKLDGMYMPFFINNGNNSVLINHTKIVAGGEFSINFPFIMQGTIPIKFLNDNNGTDPDTFQVNVYYGQPEIPVCQNFPHYE